ASRCLAVQGAGCVLGVRFSAGSNRGAHNVHRGVDDGARRTERADEPREAQAMMTSAGGGSGRRTLLLGLSGLVPAALVVLLLVNQPSYGEWRLYPSLRVPLAGAALLLALATLVSWIV